MKKTSNFYQWFKKLGGNLCAYDATKVHATLNNPQLQISSLKGRAAELNYKLNQRHRLLFDGLPKVEPTRVFDKAFNKAIR